MCEEQLIILPFKRSSYNPSMQFKHVELRYGERKILADIHFTINPGEFIFLIGASGSGKTSFIRTLVGELSPSHGQVITDTSKDLYKMNRSELAAYRRKIGVVFQDFKLLGDKTVGENVAFAMEVSGYSDHIIQKRLPEVLMEVGILAKKNALVSTLSG